MNFIDLVNHVYGILRDGNANATNPSEAFPLDLVKAEINQTYFDVFNQPNTKPYLSHKYYSFAGVPSLTVAAAVTAGDTSVSTSSTTSFPAAGSGFLGASDFIAWTGKGATSLTGVSTVSLAHAIGEYIQPLFDCPTDMAPGKVFALVDSNSPSTSYRYCAFDQRHLFRAAYGYTIVNNQLLFLDNLIGTEDFLLEYEAAPVAMVEDDAEPSLIPDNFRMMLAYGAAGRLMMADDDTRYARYYNVEGRNPKGMLGTGLFFDYLRRFFASYNKQTAIRGRPITFKAN